jgi:hypothetical protein
MTPFVTSSTRSRVTTAKAKVTAMASQPRMAARRRMR